VYLDWVKANREPATYTHHRSYLKLCIGEVGRTLKIGALKPYHLTKWLQKNPQWSSTTQNDAITIVQRMLNWGVEQGYIFRSPIPKIKKPRRGRCEVFYTEEQWQLICAEVKDGFRDLLTFLWETGCRPKEARSLEARHVHLEQDLCLFSSSESKGEEDQRVIFLTDTAKEILKRLIEKHGDGFLFRNSRGNQWTADAVVCRTRRLSKTLGFRVIAYAARHSYATNGLMNGTDSVVLSELMGHRDSSMLAKVYQKLSKNPDYLRKQAKLVRSKSS
jgi:integrase